MIIDRLIDRERELESLNAVLKRPGAALLGVTGRRRMGKTALIQHWAENSGKPYVYWNAVKRPSQLLLREFSQKLFFHENGREAPEGFSYASWDEVFEALARVASGEQKHICILDEFPYTIARDESIPSVLQRSWDHRLKRCNLTMVLCGSSIGMMERLYHSDAPLFGRLAGKPLRVAPLPFRRIREFMPGYGFEDWVTAYACFGGVPAYLEAIDPGISIIENVKYHVFQDFGIFGTEPVFLIEEQVKEAGTYLGIIEAIARGKRESREILSAASIPSGSSVHPYLNRLCEMDYVRDDLSLDIPPGDRAKARGSHYVLTDQMLQFYHRFIRKHESTLGKKFYRAFENLLKEELASFIGKNAFEEICRQWLAEQEERGGLPFPLEDVGQIWGGAVEGEPGDPDTGRVQVDVAAVNWKSRSLIIGEVKWTDNNVGADQAEKLLQVTIPKALARFPDGGKGWKVYPYLFAKRGFAKAVHRLAAARGITLVQVGPIEDDLVQI